MSIKGWLLAGAAVGALGAGVANAQPSFTLNPSAVGLNGTAFTANNETLADFATITLFPPSQSGPTLFTDNGTLAISTFGNGSSIIVPPGLNTSGGYALYYQFQGSGQQNTPTVGTGTVGTFSSLNFQFYGAPITGSGVTYSTTGGTPTGIGTPIELATGSFI
ncbi:MAG: hypothetical protein JOY70_04940, partial [Acidisphaera sp.]|nr:hypothetical protein [Acidisphaera sp.]